MSEQSYTRFRTQSTLRPYYQPVRSGLPFSRHASQSDLRPFCTVCVQFCLCAEASPVTLDGTRPICHEGSSRLLGTRILGGNAVREGGLHPRLSSVVGA